MCEVFIWRKDKAIKLELSCLFHNCRSSCLSSYSMIYPCTRNLTFLSFLLTLKVESMLAEIYFGLCPLEAVLLFLSCSHTLIFVIPAYLVLEKFTSLSEHLLGYTFIFYFYSYSLLLCPYYYILETANSLFCYRLPVNTSFPPLSEPADA